MDISLLQKIPNQSTDVSKLGDSQLDKNHGTSFLNSIQEKFISPKSVRSNETPQVKVTDDLEKIGKDQIVQKLDQVHLYDSLLLSNKAKIK